MPSFHPNLAVDEPPKHTTISLQTNFVSQNNLQKNTASLSQIWNDKSNNTPSDNLKREITEEESSQPLQKNISVSQTLHISNGMRKVVDRLKADFPTLSE